MGNAGTGTLPSADRWFLLKIRRQFLTIRSEFVGEKPDESVYAGTIGFNVELDNVISLPGTVCLG